MKLGLRTSSGLPFSWLRQQGLGICPGSSSISCSVPLAGQGGEVDSARASSTSSLWSASSDATCGRPARSRDGQVGDFLADVVRGRVFSASMSLRAASTSSSRLACPSALASDLVVSAALRALMFRPPAHGLR